LISKLKWKGVIELFESFAMQTVGNLPIRHKTRATYLSMLRLHIFPTLAHREIASIKRLDIQSTIQGLPPQTSAMSLAVIKTVFREALAQEIITDNIPRPKAATATSAMRLKVVFVDICFLSISRSRGFPPVGFG
jgi:hypothetical protein